jgi:putative membrane protein
MADRPRFLDEDPSPVGPGETASYAVPSPPDRLAGPALPEIGPDTPAERPDVMAAGPRFLDEEPLPAGQSRTVSYVARPPPDRLTGPVLLEAEPDAPAELQDTWRPQDLPVASAGGVHWTALGIAVVLVSLAVFSAINFVLSLGDRSLFLGVAAGLALSLGVGLIGYGLTGEWHGYRKLKAVDRLRATLSADAVSIEDLRVAALGWLDQVTTTLPDADGTLRAIRSAPTVVEILATLRNRAADPLHQAAKAVGRRAGLQAASLIAVSPHASWDGVIAGLRGLLVIREVARAFGLRPGLAVTLLLVRKVAWTAAGISGIDLLSQSLADHALRAVPITKHIVEKIPGSGVAALRLYRLASIAADACCPITK